MIKVSSFAHKTVAVFGLGKSGVTAALSLMAGGARVLAWDDQAASREKAAQAGIEIADLKEADWSEISALILSPGVPLNFPEPHWTAQLARANNCEIIGDVELLRRTQTQAHYVAITGTNGKSTTTSLIGHILKEGGVQTEIGGNLGIPALELDELGEGGVYVLELSSYQLDLTPTTEFNVSILLNITPDHLDRHGGMDGYVDAKKLIFSCQNSNCTAVIGVDDSYCRKIYDDLVAKGNGRVIPVSVHEPVPGGVYVQKGMLIDDMNGEKTVVMNVQEVPTLPGVHNGQNAAAAYVAALLSGLDRETISQHMATFPGLVHRQELLEFVSGVRFVNDSKATNADATQRALASYDNIYWIAGGVEKEGGYGVLDDYLPNVRRAYFIGEAAGNLMNIFGDRVECQNAGTLAAATKAAFKQATLDGVENATVLLSPACASFDQYRNFEIRGDAFKSAVADLKGSTS